MIIIGIAGTNGSGKDTIGQMLADRYGFHFASATKMLGDELTRRGLTHERENKRNLSAEWRREHGLGVIVDKGIEEAKAHGKDKVVIASLRNPGESDRVHELDGVLVWVDADPKVRYDRVQSVNRGRIEDQKTFEQFLAEQEAEMHPSGDAATLNIADVKKACDLTIYNNESDIESFKDQAEEILKDVIS